MAQQEFGANTTMLRLQIFYQYVLRALDSLNLL